MGGIPINDIKLGLLDSYIFIEDVDDEKLLRQPIVICIATDCQMLIVESENIIFKINPEIFQECIKPSFFVGDKVKYINSNKNIEFGIINDLYWHSNRREYIYKLETDGKMKTRRYYDEDLEKLNSDEQNDFRSSD